MVLYSARRYGAVSDFPKCQRCKQGDLVPLSDYGRQGSAIHYKAWACTSPACGYNIKIRNGGLYLDEPINSGALHTSKQARSQRRETGLPPTSLPQLLPSSRSRAQGVAREVNF